MPSEIFFYSDAERRTTRRTREKRAKAICASCTDLLICREFSLVSEEPYGIWGGLTLEKHLEIVDLGHQWLELKKV